MKLLLLASLLLTTIPCEAPEESKVSYLTVGLPDNFIYEGQNYQIRWLNRWRSETLYGLAECKTRVIYIRQGLSGHARRQVLLHEILHQITRCRRLKDYKKLKDSGGNKDVDLLFNEISEGYLRLMYANPDLAKFLSETYGPLDPLIRLPKELATP